MSIKITDENGLVCAVFSADKKFFYASIAVIPFFGLECMIFKCNKNGDVKNWSELYCNRNVELTSECLIKCIKEFCSENNYDFDSEELKAEQSLETAPHHNLLAGGIK